MRIFANSIWYVVLAIIFIVTALFLLYKIINPSTPSWVTTTVERGDVSETVSVSGFVEAKKTADLAFPSSGIVTDVLVEEGSRVEIGSILATLADTELVAERSEAESSLAATRASYAKTVAGPRSETVAVAKTSQVNAEENLARVIAEENRKVQNAKIALLSTGLTAVANDINENSSAPTVSGTYSCEEEGSYTISVYSSASNSGYSFTYTGLESGKGTVSIEQPSPLGSCGLYLLFNDGDFYSSSEWEIKVPNDRNSSYTTLNNSYELALTQAENAIENAKNALDLVEKESALSTAPARSEDVTGASAEVAKAIARIAAIDARMADRSIVAPFSGTVTDVRVTTGESAPNTAVITILADNAFTLKARIPEIDITKIKVDQIVRAIFDARSNETLTGVVTYISPIATQIDGVAYFETTIKLNQTPEWMRAGLNADIDIITTSKEQVLRIPKRFVFDLPQGGQGVLTPQGNKTATTSIEVIFVGNDSYLEIIGLAEGTVVVAP